MRPRRGRCRPGSRRNGRPEAGALAGVLVVGLGAGCGALQDQEEAATRAGTAFVTAVGAGDVQAACAVLAPATRSELERDEKSGCARALPTVGLGAGGAVRRVDVYGDQARVVLDGDTVFLARIDGRWRVTAAGCRPNGDQPYECALKGG